jgi:hypothetical protein
LLVEESRTNLYVYSEDALQWDYTNGSYYLDAAAIAPDGSAGAYVVYPTSSIPRINPGNISLVSGTRYTFSVFCKAKEFSTVACFWNTTSIDPNVYGSTTFVNLNTGVSSDPSIVQTVGYPNGWWRLIINGALADGNGSAHVTIVPGSTGSPNAIVPNGTDGIYAWGAQMEASASFPTSYIKNEGNPLGVTRAADVASISGSNFSSWYRQDEGTAFVQYGKIWNGNWDYYRAIARVIDSSFPTRDFIAYGVTNGNNGYQVYWQIEANDISQIVYGAYSLGFPAVPAGSWKHAIAVQVNDASFVEGGFVRKTDSPSSLPTVDTLELGTTNFHIRRLTYWPQRLPNDTLQTITQ